MGWKIRFVSSWRRMIGAALALVGVVWLPASATCAAGTALYVANSGAAIDAGNDCRDAQLPCKTITHALTQAEDGDILYLAPGAYPESLHIDKSVTLHGSGMGSTFLDGSGVSRVLEVVESAAPPPAGTQVVIEHLTVQYGGVEGDGAGLLSAASLVRLDAVRFRSNDANSGSGGGIACAGGRLLGERIVLTDNRAQAGAGLAVAAGCLLTLNRSEISLNVAERAAGALIEGTATLTNVTVSFNDVGEAADMLGGGIEVGEAGSLYLNHVTLAYTHLDNNVAASEVWVRPGGKARLTNTLIQGLYGRNCAGAESDLASLGHNLSNDATCRLNGVGDLPGVDSQLLGLMDNGGFTRTHGLPETSPAVDAAGLPDPDTPTSDQRGYPHRDGDGDGEVRGDIGAFEYQPGRVWLPVVMR